MIVAAWMWLALPRCLLSLVFWWLNDLPLRAGRVCRLWNSVSEDDCSWHSVTFDDRDGRPPPPERVAAKFLSRHIVKAEWVLNRCWRGYRLPSVLPFGPRLLALHLEWREREVRCRELLEPLVNLRWLKLYTRSLSDVVFPAGIAVLNFSCWDAKTDAAELFRGIGRLAHLTSLDAVFYGKRDGLQLCVPSLTELCLQAQCDVDVRGSPNLRCLHVSQFESVSGLHALSALEEVRVEGSLFIEDGTTRASEARDWLQTLSTASQLHTLELGLDGVGTLCGSAVAALVGQLAGRPRLTRLAIHTPGRVRVGVDTLNCLATLRQLRALELFGVDVEPGVRGASAPFWLLSFAFLETLTVHHEPRFALPPVSLTDGTLDPRRGHDPPVLSERADWWEDLRSPSERRLQTETRRL